MPDKNGLTRKEVFNLIRNNLSLRATDAYAKIEELMSCKLQHPYNLPDHTKQPIRKLIFDLKDKWQKSKRTESVFFKTYGEWLGVFISFGLKEENKETDIGGRPSTSFEDSSERSKRRKTENLRTQSSTEELSYAAQMNLRAEGKVDAAKILKHVTSSSPSKAKRYRKNFQYFEEDIFTPDEALSLFVELKFSRNKYQLLRNACLRKRSKLFPSYKEILKSKKNCYPKAEIILTETSAEIQVQPLLDHTISRILLTQLDVIKCLTDQQRENLSLICKWGCDGSSGHSKYKQKFIDDERNTDESILFTSIVPLQFIHTDKVTNKTTIIWKNPRPSSPRFCRPIRIQFLHETTEITIQETDYIKKQIDELVPFETYQDGKKISVTYQLALTMIDGNALTSNSSTQRCYLCQATSKDFNKIDLILSKPINEKSFEFDLSSLHAWIRCFECCLHLSYKLEIKKWQARQDHEKKSVQTRKENIQKGFKKELGLIVDKPKPGYGSTNDGNTARRFFENSRISAAITGVEENIIHRFYIILQVISSGHIINQERFKQYTLETARQFVQLYPWYYMPTSVHKLLIHGTEIIASSLLPIGQMSEDAQESCHKYFKIFREDFSRKYSRTKTMDDIFSRFLVSSDPYLSSCRQLPLKQLRSLSSDAITLLLPPTVKHGKIEDKEEIISTSEDSTDATNEDFLSDDDNFLF
ncbi:uncharacterized protein [Temnothorax longispinosus]|uniref:uncharacterized protein n=1 Tax=Temnothorax longispinosus TaxID=300112 RepID=UPI003A992F61